MNLQPIFLFLTQSRVGRFLTFAVLAVFSIVVVKGCQPKKPSEHVAAKEPQSSVGELVRKVQSLPSLPRRNEPQVRSNAVTEALPPIRYLGTNLPTASASASKPILPSRRLIPCRLVVTVDSFSPETPIIGTVSENVFFQGELIIPEGTEVHAKAQAGRFRDRVATQGSWTVIWSTGDELAINGLALDRDKDGRNFGATDGSYGLRGSVQQSDSAAETKLFLSTLLSGLTEPFKERRETVLGFQLAPTVENAALSGVGEVLDSYSKRLLQTIERESIFVRAPAGKEFYLYTLQTIQRPERIAVLTTSKP